jgi:glycosyltransferase involved in cell wall biosynthesis
MLFSIVIPVFNRERLIGRCLTSVLGQNFRDFEIVLVDDGSTDSSLGRVKDFADPRLTVIRHDHNRGVGPARNTAIAAATGDWIIALDSDDEVAPGALARIRDVVASAPETVDALWFRCRMDDGRLCPDPMPSRQEWDYDGFLGFLEETRTRWRDALRAVRRTCFTLVRYPDNRMLEDKFHLDFARHFISRIYPDVVRLYHQDAANRLVDYPRWLDPARDRAFLQDRADGLRALLQDHGRALRRQAPGQYGDYLQNAATSTLLAGRRRAALVLAMELAVRFPRRSRAWLVLGAAILGPDLAGRIRDFVVYKDSGQ